LPGLALIILGMAFVSNGQEKCRTCDTQRQQDKLEQERKNRTTQLDIWAKPVTPIIPRRSNARYAKFKARFVVTNDSSKKIQEVVWVCVFSDPATKGTISRSTITSRKRIAPHTNGVLTEK